MLAGALGVRQKRHQRCAIEGESGAVGQQAGIKGALALRRTLGLQVLNGLHEGRCCWRPGLVPACAVEQALLVTDDVVWPPPAPSLIIRFFLRACG